MIDARNPRTAGWEAAKQKVTKAPEIETVEQVQLLPLDLLEIHPSNPRTEVGDISGLAKSIETSGVIEPIIVARANGKYQVVAGTRRTAASRLAGKVTIPAIVRELGADEAAAAALLENLQRHDLSPLEEAKGYRTWLDLTKRPQAELARMLGRDPSTIAHALRLLEAPKPVKDALARGEIGAEHARHLLKLEDPGLAEKALKAARQWSRDEGGAITARAVVSAVEQANTEYRRSNPKIVAERKAALEAKVIELMVPGNVVTWRAAPTYADRAFEVEEYLGKPPKPVATQYEHEMRDWKSHAKDCGCKSVLLSLVEDGDDAGTVRTQVICTNVSAHRKWRRAALGGPAVTKEERAREAAKQEARERAAEAKRRRENAPLRRRIVGDGRLRTEHLRLLAMYVDPAEVVEVGYSDAGQARVDRASRYSSDQAARQILETLADFYATSDRHIWGLPTAAQLWVADTFKVDLEKLGYSTAAIGKARKQQAAAKGELALAAVPAKKAAKKR